MSTQSFAYPNMFNVTKNTGAVVNDTEAVTTRVKLLLLTEPTELYGEPDFGVGLRKYLFRYNNDNIIAEMRDRIIDQLDKWEPSVNAQATELVRTDLTNSTVTSSPNNLNLTLVIYTVYGDTASIDLSTLQ